MSTELEFYDNTEVSCHKLCPRKYYFRHELGLTRAGKAPALAFGLAWHAAMDVVWTMICNAKEKDDLKILKAAYVAWEQCWVEEGMSAPGDMSHEELDNLRMRTPDTAIEMISSYILARRMFLETKVEQLLSIERPFAVPLLPDNDKLWYCGRMDKVMLMEGRVYGVDHKTTTAYKKDGGFMSSFVDSFSPNSQVDGYAYALHLLYPGKLGGIWIDGALVHKQARHFCWIPAVRSIDALDAWLYHTRTEIGLIEKFRADLKAADPNSNYLPSFPMHDRACWDFNSPCTYLDLCKGVPNPDSFISTNGIPDSYSIEHWSPFDVNQMEELGFKRDEVKHG